MRSTETAGRKTKHPGRVLTIIGALLIAAAIALSVYNLWTAHRAAASSYETLRSIDLSNALTPQWYTERDMPVVTVDGVDYIGVLTIPDLDLQLPVAADWSYDQLLSSPCRYTGNYFMNDMVVCAHNYQAHFGGLISCDLGLDVYFQSVEGYVFKYKVSDRKTIQPESVLEMIINRNNFEKYLESDLGGADSADNTDIQGEVISTDDGDTLSREESEEWDLTLYTCNWGGRTRCAVRCTRVRE